MKVNDEINSKNVNGEVNWKIYEINNRVDSKYVSVKVKNVVYRCKWGGSYNNPSGVVEALIRPLIIVQGEISLREMGTLVVCQVFP